MISSIREKECIQKLLIYEEMPTMLIEGIQINNEVYKGIYI